MVVLYEQTEVHPHCSPKPYAVVLHEDEQTDGSLMQRQPLPLGKCSVLNWKY